MGIIVGLLLLMQAAGRAIGRDPFDWGATLGPAPHAAEHIISQFLPLHYANATAVAAFLNNRQNGLLSSTGYVSADHRTNQLWIRDTAQQWRLIQKAVQQLDTPIAQLLIKVRIISIDENQLHSLGIVFGSVAANAQTRDGLTMDNPSTESSDWQIADIPILKLGNGHLLDLTLSALAEDGTVRMLSSPELMTSDRQTATIESGESIPYQEKSGAGNTSVAFKKAALRLKVTPTLLPSHRILLQLSVNQDKISPLVINGVPAITTRQLNTQVMVNDQDTVVLGGIYEKMEQRLESGIPVLRKLPILGALFRHRKHIQERKQLLIFLTPRVLPMQIGSHEKR